MFVHVRVPFIICDEKDLASCVTGMYASSNTRRPCNVCTCDFNNQSIVDLGDERSLKHMSQVRTLSGCAISPYLLHKLLSNKPTIKKLKKWSIHPEPNALFTVPGLNVFRTPSCMLHSLDHGIFVRLLDMTCAFVEKSEPAIRHDFEARYLNIILDKFILILLGGVKCFHTTVSRYLLVEYYS